tara:strand:+ start:480 stop:614 length:135 start_codon:yes stop_codon:yes gene_type:complete
MKIDEILIDVYLQGVESIFNVDATNLEDVILQAKEKLNAIREGE